MFSWWTKFFTVPPLATVAMLSWYSNNHDNKGAGKMFWNVDILRSHEKKSNFFLKTLVRTFEKCKRSWIRVLSLHFIFGKTSYQWARFIKYSSLMHLRLTSLLQSRMMVNYKHHYLTVLIKLVFFLCKHYLYYTVPIAHNRFVSVSMHERKKLSTSSWQRYY